MSIDYYGVETELRELLQAAIPEVVVAVEEEMVFSEGQPFIGIYLDRREAPDGLQTLSAGQRVRYRLTFSIWVWAIAIEKDVAIKTRNDLIGRVEQILMANREWHEQIETSWIGGGELQSGRSARNDFIAGGEITVIADASVII